MADTSDLVVIVPALLTTISTAGYFMLNRRDKATDKERGESNRRRRADFNCSKVYELMMTARQGIKTAIEIRKDDPAGAWAVLLLIDSQPLPPDPMAEFYGNGKDDEGEKQ